MTADTRDPAFAIGDHVVGFYEHDGELFDVLVPYLLSGARSGDALLLIATEPHRRTLEAELASDGVELASARSSGQLISLDADGTIAAFMRHGQIDHEAFRRVLGGLVRKAAGSGRPVRAYGEMVALLWERGDVLAAIELERLWNELGGELPFSLFCSYPAAIVSEPQRADAVHQLCQLHSSVLPSSAGALPGNAEARPEQALAATFPAERVSPARARRLLVDALGGWGEQGPPVQDAALVLSELASNAVRHAGTPFSIDVRLQGSTLTIAVEDHVRPLSSAGDGGLVAQRTHGLGLVDALSERWGVEGTGAGKQVWARLVLRTPAADRSLADTVHS